MHKLNIVDKLNYFIIKNMIKIFNTLITYLPNFVKNIFLPYTSQNSNIIFNIYFNNDLPDYIINDITNAKKITFGWSFNKTIKLNSSQLKEIEFGQRFNQRYFG